MLLRLLQGANDFSEEIFSERFNVFRSNNIIEGNNFKEDVITGFTSEKKYLFPKYFYDSRGSDLFEQICKTDEYYLTRTEEGILKEVSDFISEINSEKSIIAELGSGNSAKTGHIIDSFLKTRNSLLYVPLDISDILIESSDKLICNYNNLFISGIISYYEEGLEYLYKSVEYPKLIIFLGSSIGNFSPDEAVIFLTGIKKVMKSEDSLLIGFDMVKDKHILNNAYNDRKGITSKFNLNILNRINRELGADFNTSLFEHNAIYNEEQSRIEMYLVIKSDSEFKIPDLDKKIKFIKGERIHTENSYKFTPDKISELAVKSGLQITNCFTDSNKYFSIYIFK